MKISQWMMVALGVGAMAAACSKKTPVNTTLATASTGVGAATGSTVSGGPVTAPSSSSTGNPTSSGMGGGTPMGCDTGMKGDVNSMQCSSCLQCAQQGDCAAQTVKCQGMNSNCGKFEQCRVACIKSCDMSNGMDHTTMAWLKCFDDCTGFGSPMMPPAMSCIGTNQMGYTDWNAWFTCMFNDCGTNCGTGWPICDSGFSINGSQACAQCAGQNCCGLFKACNMDANCNQCAQMMGCMDPKLQTANACLQNMCKAQCM